MTQMQSLVLRLLDIGLLEAVAKGVPWHRQASLEPFVSIPQVVNLAVRILTGVVIGHYDRVKMYDDGELVFHGLKNASSTITEQSINELREGAALVVNSLELSHMASDALCSLLGIILQAEVWINAYLGSSGSVGLSPHYDDHEIIVLQQEGQKSWQIYTPDASTEVMRVTLCPGDSLYIPPGYYHVAETCRGGDSLHATIGAIFSRKGFERQDLATSVVTLS